MPLSVAFSDTRRFVVDEEFDVDGYAGASELGGPSTRRGDVLLTRSVVRASRICHVSAMLDQIGPCLTMFDH